MADQTIILMIQKSATKFDTSPEAVIELKKAGVSDAVLNAILGSSSTGLASPNSVPTSQPECSIQLDKVLSSLGSIEKINDVHSIRTLAEAVVNRPTGNVSVHTERVVLLSGSIYLSVQQSSGLPLKTVITPAFSYLTSGKMTSAVPPETMQELLSQFLTDPMYVAQHRSQYACTVVGDEQIGNIKATTFLT